MTAHNHSTRIPGCYRCELGEDEARAQQTDPPVHSEAVRRKVEDLCHEIGRLRQELNTEREKAEQEQRLTDGDLYVAVQEVRRLREAVERVRQLHSTCGIDTCGRNAPGRCHGCEQDYPCSTIRALDGAE